MERADCLVVGAGVVGLACARALALTGREVVIVEAEDAIGTQTSSRNSEVVHAGLYYPSGSLKARLCVSGRESLYEYCATRQVSHRRCGKVIVATEANQEADLAAIQDQALANGVEDVRPMTRAEVGSLEPAVRCTSASFSPSTGIVDSHGLMRALLADARDAGSALALRTPFQRAVVSRNGIRVEVGGREAVSLEATVVVNAAGLWASQVAARIEGLAPEHVPATYLARGVYAQLTGRAPFSHLVYPVPEPGGLGVHLTLDLAGRARFGPDVEWVSSVDYSVDARRVWGFAERIRRYWPGLPDDALVPGFAGIRPKLAGPGAPAHDFRIDGEEVHGVPGLVNLFGIESPGLTASLAIAQEVVAALG